MVGYRTIREHSTRSSYERCYFSCILFLEDSVSWSTKADWARNDHHCLKFMNVKSKTRDSWPFAVYIDIWLWSDCIMSGQGLVLLSDLFAIYFQQDKRPWYPYDEQPSVLRVTKHECMVWAVGNRGDGNLRLHRAGAR